MEEGASNPPNLYPRGSGGMSPQENFLNFESILVHSEPNIPSLIYSCFYSKMTHNITSKVARLISPC